MLPLYSFCSVLLQLICAVLMQCAAPEHHHRKSMIYLCRVRVLLSVSILGYIVKCYLCPCVRVPCLVVFRYGWILFKCGYIRYMIYSLYSVCVYIQDTIKIVLCYCVLIQQADFLLVNIYTLRNGLRDRVLRESVSGITADLAHFYA